MANTEITLYFFDFIIVKKQANSPPEIGKTSEDWYFKIISSEKNKKKLVSIILFAIVSITAAIL